MFPCDVFIGRVSCQCLLVPFSVQGLRYGTCAMLGATRRKKFLGSCTLDQSLEPLGLGHRQPITKIGKTVVATPLVVEFGIRTFFQLLDKTVLEHPFDRSVESAGPQAHLSLSAFVDLPHDVVTMPLSVRQRQQDMKHCRRQRQPSFWFFFRHNYPFLVLSIASRYIGGRYSSRALCRCQ